MRKAFNASTIPSIEGLDAAQAERAFISAGWTALKNNDGGDPGHNSHVLFSPDGHQVARIATGNDPGFEAFASSQSSVSPISLVVFNSSASAGFC